MEKFSFQAFLFLKWRNTKWDVIKNGEHGIHFYSTLSCLPSSLFNSKTEGIKNVTSESVSLPTLTLQLPTFLSSRQNPVNYEWGRERGDNLTLPSFQTFLRRVCFRSPGSVCSVCIQLMGRKGKSYPSGQVNTSCFLLVLKLLKGKWKCRFDLTSVKSFTHRSFIKTDLWSLSPLGSKEIQSAFKPSPCIWS